ncbi:MAG: hypothetical protein AAF415_17840 [Pseudomonadota bacterium]
MPNTARARLSRKAEPKRVMLDRDFAGVRRGQMLFVATPQIVADYIAKIPRGETRTIPQMRGELARRRKCDATCPVSTAIFIRLVAEAAIEEIEEGTPQAEVTPFWRLIAGDYKIARRLPIDGEWIDLQRRLEVDKPQ